MNGYQATDGPVGTAFAGLRRQSTWGARRVLPGITERLEFVDAPGHVADLKRYRTRGYAMTGNRMRFVTDRAQSALEVHPPSVNSVAMAGVTVEYRPPRPLPASLSRPAERMTLTRTGLTGAAPVAGSAGVLLLMILKDSARFIGSGTHQ